MEVGGPGSDHLTISPVLSAPASGCVLIASGAELQPADYLHCVLPRRHFGRLATATVKAIQTVKTRIRTVLERLDFSGFVSAGLPARYRLHLSPASLGTL
jgi:hypothetical protein